MDPPTREPDLLIRQGNNTNGGQMFDRSLEGLLLSAPFCRAANAAPISEMPPLGFCYGASLSGDIRSV
jgi:hypothetical protein